MSPLSSNAMACEQSASPAAACPAGLLRRRRRGQASGVFRPNLAAVCRKTRLCTFFLEGSCERGEACRFAHGVTELQAAPDLERTKLCPLILLTGMCSGGASCKYAHKAQELRGTADSESDRQSTEEGETDGSVQSGWQSESDEETAERNAWPALTRKPSSPSPPPLVGVASIGQLPHTGEWTVHHSTGIEVSVRNTFIDARDPFQEEVPRRPRSLPPRRA